MNTFNQVMAMETFLRKYGTGFMAVIPQSIARKMSLSAGYRVLITPVEQKQIKAVPRKKWGKALKKTKKNDLNLSKQAAELYGILEGVHAPDKKEFRKAMYESNH